MARISLKKGYIEKDVLAAATERVHHIFDTHDKVIVCFSGGKDSLAVLHLVKDVVEERGGGKVNVLFWDEELIPDCVIEFVNSYRLLPWVNMVYLAVPLASTKYILGRTFDYIQWDPNRPHVREVPAHAVTLPPGDSTVMSQYTLNQFSARLFCAKGKVAFLNGMRAAESLNRLRASLCKENFNYINLTESKDMVLCKPLYDWEENDIFKFFMDRGIKYCTIYDHQIMAGVGLRVATPLHAEAAKRLNRLREIDPEFLNRIFKVFPEVQVQARYYDEFDMSGIRRIYGLSLAGVRSYIMEKYSEEGGQLELALDRLGQIERADGHYPPEYVLDYFIGGAIKRMLAPKYLRTSLA